MRALDGQAPAGFFGFFGFGGRFGVLSPIASESSTDDLEDRPAAQVIRASAACSVLRFG